MTNDLPPGVTQAMCEVGIIDENTPCASCDHKLIDHGGTLFLTNADDDENCTVEDCDCKEWTEGWEPDMEYEHD